MNERLTVAKAEIRQLRPQQQHVRPSGERVFLPNASEELQQGRARLLRLVDQGHRVVHADDRHRVIRLGGDIGRRNKKKNTTGRTASEKQHMRVGGGAFHANMGRQWTSNYTTYTTNEPGPRTTADDV